jgi:hypothetical protein
MTESESSRQGFWGTGTYISCIHRSRAVREQMCQCYDR